MYGASAGLASAASGGPAGCHAPRFQLPGAGDHDDGPPGTGLLPPAGRPPVPGKLTTTPTAAAATAAVTTAAAAALRIPRFRARLRRIRMSGTGRVVTGRTHSASCSRSSSSSIGHLLVVLLELAFQPVPGRRQPVPDRAHGDTAIARDVFRGQIGQVIQDEHLT